MSQKPDALRCHAVNSMLVQQKEIDYYRWQRFSVGGIVVIYERTNALLLYVIATQAKPLYFSATNYMHADKGEQLGQ